MVEQLLQGSTSEAVESCHESLYPPGFLEQLIPDKKKIGTIVDSIYRDPETNKAKTADIQEIFKNLIGLSSIQIRENTVEIEVVFFVKSLLIPTSPFGK